MLKNTTEGTLDVWSMFTDVVVSVTSSDDVSGRSRGNEMGWDAKDEWSRWRNVTAVDHERCTIKVNRNG